MQISQKQVLYEIYREFFHHYYVADISLLDNFTPNVLIFFILKW
jgi:hypothetical protein